MGLKWIPVDGATGDYYTNYAGKAQAAISALEQGSDFVLDVYKRQSLNCVRENPKERSASSNASRSS